MRLVILHVPDCPNTAVLESRLAPILADRPDIHITRKVITTDDQAHRQGMAGSPTLLLDGSDPFARPGQQPSLSCRRYPGDDGRPGPAPSAQQLRTVLNSALQASNQPGTSTVDRHRAGQDRPGRRPGVKVAGVAQPVLLVVDDEDASLRALVRELESRYGTDYRIVASPSAEDALTRLAGLVAQDSRVALILADQWMPGLTGAEFLARARELDPAARRGLLISWGDRSAAAPILEAVALGQIEFYLPKPAWSPDEQFHRAITESLEQWWHQQGGRFEAVTVIGDDPSARAHEIRDILARNNVPFGFIRSDSGEGRAALQRLGVRDGAGPVVALYTGAVLVDPSNVEVAEALGAAVRPPDPAYDVVIVGAGPAGLAAAVYGASEGLRTALLEREAFGGQAGTSSLIRNFLGFPHGVSGIELAWRAYQQAWNFGTHLIYGNPAVSLAEEDPVYVLTLQDGTEVRSRAVIIAAGVSYRRLQAPGLESLTGAGVFYGAATVAAQAMAGKPVFVVGGGNSAGQAAVHLSKYAGKVTILVRSKSLAASMSQYLIREIGSAPNIEVRFGAEVAAVGGAGRLQYVDLLDCGSGRVGRAPAAGLFILIGAEPFTEWLPGIVAHDPWGYILTGPDTGERWQQQRAPLLLETSLPGVFAVGDVRHGSVKRVASAVGEGSIAIRLVHEYLALAPGPARPDGGSAHDDG